jgi:hypothetical protein
VVRVAQRDAYMKALEMASVGGDIAPFARFIASEMRAGPAPTAPPTRRKAS